MNEMRGEEGVGLKGGGEGCNHEDVMLAKAQSVLRILARSVVTTPKVYYYASNCLLVSIFYKLETAL